MFEHTSLPSAALRGTKANGLAWCLGGEQATATATATATASATSRVLG
jgi:hypothetical protein